MSLSPNLNENYVSLLREAAAYLFSVVKDVDLEDVPDRQEKVDALNERYDNPSSDDERDLVFLEIRRALRVYAGDVDERYDEAFRDIANRRFDKVWNALSLEDQKRIVAQFEFERFDIPNVARFDFHRSCAEVLEQFKQGVDSRYGKSFVKDDLDLRVRAAEFPNFAFALCECVYAVDDYKECRLNYESPEVKRLHNALMTILERVVESSNSQPFATSSTSSKGGSCDGLNYANESKNDETSDDPDDSDDELDGAVLDSLKPDGYYPVDERLAREAKRAVSYDEYEPMSETNLYRGEVDKVRAFAEKRKSEIDARFHEQVDRLLNRFERRLAEWYDQRNSAEASCPSVLIVGPSNFPMRKHNAKMERLSALYKMRDEIFEIVRQIEGIGSANYEDDENELESLERSLRSLYEERERMKAANAYLRRHGNWEGYEDPDYVADLYDRDGIPRPFYEFSVSEKIRRLEGRVAFIKRQAITDYGDGWKFEGGVAKVDKEDNRLRIIFDTIPDVEAREKLKSKGFRWSPKHKAWQRKLTPDAIWAGTVLGYIPADWKPRFIESQDESSKK